MKKISQFLDGVRSKCSALWSKLYVRLIVLALLFIFPHVVPNQYVVYIGVIVMHLGIEILGYNFITGYNTFTMGQAAFCGLGAYFSVYISMHTSIPVTVCIILGGFFAALCGLIISLPTQKLRITFLSLATMGLNQLLYIIFKNAEPLTGGTYGTKDIPRPVLFGSAMSNNWYFDYTLIFLILSIVVIERILMSKSGRVVLALAVDPTVASAMGVDIRKYRTLMFSIAAFFGGIGGASKCGILVKGGNYLEALAKADTVVFDKTGTLTKGTFAVSAIHPEAGFEADQVLEYAALAEQYSTHPIAISLREACKSGMDRSRVSNVEEIAGHGIMAEVDGKRVGVGNSRLMERQSVNWLPCELPGTIVHVTIDGFYAGHIVIADQPKPDAKEAIVQLKAMGVKKTVMLTGDTKEVAHTVADALGLDEYHAELLPADKVTRVEELLKQETGKLAFVGDGINDAPVLTRADIGIAMGGLGSDAAIEAADIVLMDDQPTKIAAAIRIARKTVRIVRENIVFALTVKAIVLVMGALGKAPMWLAVFADVGVAFLAILNAMRCLYTEKDKK